MSPSFLLQFGSFLYFIIIAVVHVALSIGVYRDAIALRSKGMNTFFVTPVVWAGATLLGGVISLLAYWFIHHSSLKSDSPSQVDSADGDLSKD